MRAVKTKSREYLAGLIAGCLLGIICIPLAATADNGNSDSVKSSVKKTMESTEDTVRYKSDQASSALKDAWIDGKLEAALLFNEHLNSFAIDTDVNSGVATLSGAVESDIDKDLAAEIAESIDGVRQVDNDLVVDKSKVQTASQSNSAAATERRDFKDSVMDATLTAKVKSQLLVNNNTGGLSINVDSNNGTVTLTGKVDSGEEKSLAGKIASNTGGVDSVKNQLTVEEQAEEAE